MPLPIQPARTKNRRRVWILRKGFVLAYRLMRSVYADRRRFRRIWNGKVRCLPAERVICRKMQEPDAVFATYHGYFGRKQRVCLKRQHTLVRGILGAGRVRHRRAVDAPVVYPAFKVRPNCLNEIGIVIP